MSLFYINCDCGEKIPKNGDIGAPPRKKPKFWGFGLRDELPTYDRKCPKCGAEYKKYWIVGYLQDLSILLMLPIILGLAIFICEIFNMDDLFIYVLLAVFVVLFCAEIFVLYTQPYKKIIKKE
ncbi:MAG: hypothetical protein MSC50_08230 [Campylobacter sp.]|uniref:hypothetical protein n=1 Tax=Campylobacter sp. TaxID=205 RepID=UPI002AA6047B|nr:hypothetical protein [Campylobacter sp.]MCI6580242.1 hypothetical protein [Campylobacter sp.]